MKISPLIKGIITGAAILCTTLAIFYSKLPGNSFWHYSVFILYAAGIVWAVVDYSRTPAFSGKFGELFGQAFRCIVVVTLMMVIFTFVFNSRHPEFAEQDTALQKEYLDKEVKDRTAAEKEEMLKSYKKNYTQQIIRNTTFGYLMSGLAFTVMAAGSILLIRKK